MASSGAVLSLDAIGKQETFITSNTVSESVFNYDPSRHSNFSLYQSALDVFRPAVGAAENWPFNQTVQFSFDPKTMGDLLANMYIACTLPELEDKLNYRKYTDNIGLHLIKKLTFRVDEHEIETIYGDWIVAHSELFNNLTKKRALQKLVNNPAAIIIPIPIFFSHMFATSDTENKLMDNDYFKNYFPLCAIHRQKILITIEFNPISFFTDTKGECNLTKFTCITEEVVLTPEEKNYLTLGSMSLTYNTVRRQPILDVEAGTVTIKSALVSDIPVRSLFWFFRRLDFENVTDTTKIDFRFNFSNNDTNQALHPIMSNMNIFINGVNSPGPSVDPTREALYARHFFKYIQSGLYPPDRDIFSYTFSLKPHDPYPTGELDFKKVTAERAFLQGVLHKNATSAYKFHAYYTGFINLKFDNGFMSI
jgi:hypothetical protein